MTGRFLRALAAAALAVAGAGSAVAAPAATRAAQRDWTQVLVQTPAGGVRMGNPAAAIKLVEYVSLTCSHCRAFAQEGVPALLAGKVRSGQVSLELRNYVLNPIDEAAAVLSRCAAQPARYWALSDAMLAEQPVWIGRLTEAEYRRISALPDSRRLVQFAAVTGLDAIAARHGVTATQARACLTDPARLARVRAIKAAGTALGVTGTPTFTINGGAPYPLDWAGLEPLLTTEE